MRYRILPYKQGSKSAKALADALGGKVLKLEGSKYVQRPSDCVINWGRSVAHLSGILNPGALTVAASNKLLFFNRMKEVNPDIIPKFWVNKEEIPDDAYPIVCRTILSGHSGAGIVIASDSSGLVDAPLYVQYVKKQDEYRIHCGKIQDGGRVLAVQRKARRNECETPNWQIRSHANGFNFVREGVNPPEHAIWAALQAFEATSLDFGAIDVIFNNQQGKAYVLEINTAPGLEGQTIADYAAFFKQLG